MCVRCGPGPHRRISPYPLLPVNALKSIGATTALCQWVRRAASSRSSSWCCATAVLYVEFTLSQSMEQFLACHQHAFEFFGNRLPKAIMVDNLKSAVLRRLTGEPPVLNARYRDNVFPKLMLRRRMDAY